MMKYVLASLAVAAMASIALAQEVTESPVHPSCTAEAEKECHDTCREKNYELLDDFVDVLIGDGPEPTRRRRGVLPDFVLDFLGGYLRNNARCNQVRFRQKRNGECVCKCKTKPVRLDCSLIENGGFQQGSEWKVDSRGDAIGEVTDDMFFSHYPSPLPLGNNGNYQGIAAGIDHFCDNGPDRRRRGSPGGGDVCDYCSGNYSTCGTGPGQMVLRQHFKVPEDADHVVLAYGMATDGDGFMPFIGPNAQGYRVDIMTEKAPKYSAAEKHVVMPLVAQAGFSEPNIYAHDISNAVAGGGKFVLRYTASALLKPQTVQVDHVHMCAIKCGRDWEQSEPKEEEEPTEEPV